MNLFSWLTFSDADIFIEHSNFMPTDEAKEAMAVKLEQARAKMKHSVLDGTRQYTKAAQTDVSATIARVIGEQGKTRIRKVK